MESKMILVCESANTAKTLLHQINTSLCKRINFKVVLINDFPKSENNNLPTIRNSFVVFSSESVYNYAKSLINFDASNKILIGQRILSAESLYLLHTLPDYESVLVVNDTEESTIAATKLLSELQNLRLRFMPYSLQKGTSATNFNYCVIFDEENLTPDSIQNTLNLGSRIFDYPTLSKIAHEANSTILISEQSFNQNLDLIMKLNNTIRQKEQIIFSLRNYIYELINNTNYETSIFLNNIYSENHESPTSIEMNEIFKMQYINDLVSGISHEMGTPLGNALASSDMLNRNFDFLRFSTPASLDELDDDFIDECSSAINIVQSSVSRMIKIIETLKRLSTHQYSYNELQYDLSAFFHEIIINNKYAKRMSVKLSSCLDTHVDFNKNYLYVLLNSLLSNAYNHAYQNFSKHNKDNLATKLYPKNSMPIDIYITQIDSILEIIIQDYGIGIKKEKLKRVFDPFYTTRRGFEFMGLGLYLARLLTIGTISGNIEIISHENKGTKVRVLLPLKDYFQKFNQSSNTRSVKK